MRRKEVVSSEEFINENKKKPREPKLKINIDNLKIIEPLNDRQRDVEDAYNSDKNMVLHGSAGTGKSFLSLYLGLEEVLDKDSRFKKVLLVRSAVPAVNIGALPGTLLEKTQIYEDPYIDICNKLFINTQKPYHRLLEQKSLEFCTTSYLRGLSFDNVLIIVDEIQNCTGAELNTIITRVGQGSKIIFCGDKLQSDLKKTVEKIGLTDFINILHRMTDDFAFIEFTAQDVVRSGLVKAYLKAQEELEMYF